MYITCCVLTAENLEYPSKENKQVMNESQCQYVILVHFLLGVGGNCGVCIIYIHNLLWQNEGIFL